MLAFSTSWNASRHVDGEELVNEVILLGFDTIEVSGDARAELLPGLQLAVDQGRIRVSGMQGTPFSERSDSQSDLTSANSETRNGAVRSILKSITLGAKLDADYLILDLGMPDLNPISSELGQMAADGRLNDRKFVQRKIEMIQLRESLSADLTTRISDVLKVILPYAEEKNVSITFRVNDLYGCIPTIRELNSLLSACDSPALGYWHNFSAAARQANLDFLDHTEVLTMMRDRFVGAHINDCQWPGQGGLVPGHGDIAFERLLPLLPTDPLLVWSLDQKCKSSDIKSSLKKFQTYSSFSDPS